MLQSLIPTLPRADYAPFEIVIFDCDSTLSDIEGIDELGALAGKKAEIEALTNQAMNGDIPLEEVYGRRLEMLQPTRDQLRQVGKLYRERMIPAAREVIAALHALGRKVFIVSGGLAVPVQDFGEWLGLPADRIFAVEVEYNELAGNWWEPWKQTGRSEWRDQYLVHDHGPLTMGKGKAEIIRHRIRKQHRGRALLVGDGTSDLEAGIAVDMFVGFGGVVAREKVRKNADVFVPMNHLAPILPLALARPTVPEAFNALYQQGIEFIANDSVTFRDDVLREGLLARLKNANAN